MIKNIVYDLGNVLIKFRPENFLEEYIDISDRERVFKTIFCSEYWLDLDRGVLSYEEAIRIFSEKEPKYSESIKELFNSKISCCLEPIEENIKIFEKHLKEGYNLYILSNFHKDAFEEVYEKWSFLRKFHGKVVSYRCNFLKPEKEIYLELLNNYNLVPEETLFIDDSKPNIVAAEKFGIRTIYLDTPLKLEEKLKEINL